MLLFGHLDLLRSNADPKGTPRQKNENSEFFRVMVTFHGGKIVGQEFWEELMCE